MPSLGELKVWIESDGITLEEYATETLEKEATCFISSVTGQIFSIGCHNSSHQDVVIQIRVDGQIIGASICYKKTNVIKKGVDISSTSYRPFVFGKLDVTDDDAMKDKSKWQNLGCIEIIVLRVNAIAPSSIAVADMTSKFKAVPVHERSKKAGTHRVDEPGQEFMIRVKSDVDLDATETTLFRINVDGHSLTGKVCFSGTEKFVDGLSVSNTLFRPFVFATWSSDEEPEAGCNVLDSLGLLSPPTFDQLMYEESKFNALGEDSSLRDNTGMKRKFPTHAEPSPRPSRKMKQEPIYPSTYTPVKSEMSDFTVVDESDLELEAMEERLRSLQSAIQRKKARRSSQMPMKKELTSPIRVPLRPQGGPIVIDLT
ncbi:hypothetical protein EUX98_g1760 [Antrodiella citrinella]|uniref:DUF7918 domain-containing protein n=1 Tax=Antrodiella citrinella TaxID=2447956 RepID=A0A4V3XJB2_9APHY|nr:hypothetical protein EUX98_g1760 [Antrodiella citrinella]